MGPELWVEVSQLRVGEKREIGKEHSEHVRRPRVSRASSRTERISLGMEQRLPWVGRTARWKKNGESEPVNAGPKGNGEPLKDAQQGSDIITFMFFLFERSVDCRVLATRNKRKGFEE